MVDIAVIGSGPAGLSCAIEGVQAGLSVTYSTTTMSPLAILTVTSSSLAGGTPLWSHRSTCTETVRA